MSLQEQLDHLLRAIVWMDYLRKYTLAKGGVSTLLSGTSPEV